MGALVQADVLDHLLLQHLHGPLPVLQLPLQEEDLSLQIRQFQAAAGAAAAAVRLATGPRSGRRPM